MLKRLISMILAFSMILSACPVYAAAEEITENPEPVIVETTAAPTEAEPETQAPETEAPAPETEAEATTEAATVPATEETTAATTAPETEPEETVPVTTVPETAPEETVPATTVPETEPEETVPATTVPETEPEETIPEAAAGEELLADDEAAWASAIAIAPGDVLEGILESGKSLYLTFTAPKAGTYLFWNGSSQDLLCNGDWLYNRQDAIELVCEEGDVCSFKITNNEPDSLPYELYLAEKQQVAHTAISEGDVLIGEMDASEVMELTFTAPKTATYLLWNDSGYGVTAKWQVGETLHSLTLYDASYVLKVPCTAGETYTIQLENYRDSESVPYTLHLKESAGPTTLLFERDSLKIAVGYSDNIRFSYSPSYAVLDDVTWEIDESIATATYRTGNSYVNTTAAAPGTTTLRATLPNGSTAECQITVAALKTIFCDDSQPEPLKAGDTAGYRFTAPESAYYFFSDNAGNELNMRLEDADGNYKASGESIQVQLTEGQEYRLYVRSYEDCSSLDLRVTKCVPAEGLTLTESTYTDYVGGWIEIEAELLPANALSESITWEIDDPSIASIDDYSSSVDLELLAPGTATLTATTENGLSASCTIISKEKPALSVGGEADIQTDVPFESHLFTFTPEEDGHYVLWEKNHADTYIYIMSDDLDQSSIRRLPFDAVAGTTYEIEFSSPYRHDGSLLTLCLDQVAPVESLKLSAAPYYQTGFNGAVWVSEVTPGNGDLRDLTWSIEDETIAQIGLEEPGMCILNGQTAGSTTVTAACGEASAQCTILVKATEAIAPGFQETHTLDVDETVSYAFTPDVSGEYVFWTESDTYSTISILDTFGQAGYGTNHVQFQAEAGTTYTIQAGLYQEGSTVTMHLDTPAPLESMALNHSVYLGKSGSQLELVVQEILPGNADLDSIVWTSSSPSVARFVYTDGLFALMNLVGEGTSIITATCGDVIASCTIVVGQYTPISAGDNLTGELESGQSLYLSFTAPEDGTYMLWNESYESLRADWTNGISSDRIWLEYPSNILKFTCKKGAEVQFQITNDNYYYCSYDLHLEKALDPESIFINNSSLSGVTGQTLGTYFSYSPSDAVLDNVKWEILDETVATYRIEDDYCHVKLLAPGTTTLRATLPNGSYDECQITAVEAGTIECDVPQTEKFEYGDVYGYWFTAPEDGTYYFAHSSENDVSLQLTDENGYGCGSGNTIRREMTAGNKYLLTVRSYSYKTITITVTKCVPAEGIAMEKESYSGYVGNTLRVDANFLPEHSLTEEVTWTISDPTIAEKNYSYDAYISLNLLKAGTVTLTAATESGLSASCTVTVLVSEAIEAGGQKTLYIEEDGNAQLSFTPEEDGEYILWEAHGSYMSVNVYDEDGDWQDSTSSRDSYQFKAGVTYTITIYNWNSDNYFIICLDKTAPLSGITLDTTSISGMVGDSEYIEILEFQPANAITSDLVWTVDDESIATITDSYSESCIISLLKSGSTTLTATCNGVSASCRITVSAPIEITAGYRETMFIQQDERKSFVFTPDKTDDYLFRAEGDGYLNLTVRDSSGNQLSYGDNRTQFRGEAGQPYYISARNYNWASAFTLSMGAVAPLQSMTLNHTTYDGWLNQQLYLEIVEYSPYNADMSDLTWTIADPSIAEVKYHADLDRTLSLIGVGSTTITASCGDISVSCEVTVREPASITAPLKQELTLAPDQVAGFTFTPEEDGNYVLWDENNEYASLRVYEEGEELDRFQNRIQFSVQAGKSYTLLVENVQSDTRDLSINLALAVAPEKLTLSPQIYNGCVGQNMYLSLSVSPFNAWLEPISWSISDPTILLKNYSDQDSCQLTLMAEGTASVTATSGELSAVCTVNSQMPVSIEAPFKKTVSIPALGMKAYSFTAPETKEYVLWNAERYSDNAETYSANFEIYDSNGWHIDQNSHRIQFSCAAGATYLILVHNGNNTEASFQLQLKEATSLKSISFGIASATISLEELWGFTIDPEPVNGDLTGIQFTSSNEDIFAIHYVGDDYVVVQPLKKGTATLTAACGGKTATIKVTVSDEEHEHKFTSVVTKPTCTEEGYTTYTCSSCGYSYVDNEKEALGHKWNKGTVTTKPTEDTEGVKTFTCTRCDETKTEPVDKLPHKHSHEGVKTDPTCTEKGFTTYTCKCGDSYVDDEVKALGHKWDEGTVTIQPTEESQGEMTYKCTRCEETKTEVIPALPHDHVYTSVVTDPTCTEKGFTTYTCKCGESYVDDEVKALGHSFSDWAVVQPATEMEEGSEERICSVCQYTETREIARLELQIPVVTISGNETDGTSILSWNAVPAAAKYRIFRSTSKTRSYKQIDDTTELTYEDTDANPAKTYYYKIQAVTSDDVTSEYSEIVSRLTTLPQMTFSVGTDEETGKITLAWEKMKSAKKYTIARSDNGTGGWENIKTTSSTSFTDKTAEGGKTYYYRVMAVASKTDANSIWSEILPGVCKLAQPEIELEGNDVTGLALLTWDAIDGAVKYEISRRAEGEENFAVIGTVTGCTFDEDFAAVGTTYEYRIQAIAENTAASSEFSNTESRIAALPRPVIALENAEDTGKIQVSWEKVDLAAGYEIYRATSKSGKYKRIASTDGLSYTDDDVSATKVYYYKVVAVSSNEDASSAYSEAQSLTCKLEQPAITLIREDGEIQVRWSKIKSASKYLLSRSENGEDWEELKTTKSTKFTDDTTVGGKTYFYKLQALGKKDAADSAESQVQEAICILATPEITAEIDSASGKIALRWDAVKDAGSYLITRSETEDGRYTKVGETDEVQFVDTTAVVGITYFYKVRALTGIGAGNSDDSNTESGTCIMAAPVLTVKTEPVSGDPVLSWAAVDGAAEYDIYRSTSKSGKYKRIETVAEPGFQDDSASGGKTYYYKVKAVHENEDLSSELSAYQSQICGVAQPQLTAVRSSSTKVKLSWKKLTGASKYQIEYSTDGGETWEILKTTTSTKYTAKVTAGTTYAYRLTALAKKAEANSILSEVVIYTAE